MLVSGDTHLSHELNRRIIWISCKRYTRYFETHGGLTSPKQAGYEFQEISIYCRW